MKGTHPGARGGRQEGRRESLVLIPAADEKAMMKPVEIYTKEGCPYTRGLKRKLEHDGLSYVTYDVLEDPTRMQEMLALNGQRREVPTIVWPGEGMEVGFHGT